MNYHQLQEYARQQEEYARKNAKNALANRKMAQRNLVLWVLLMGVAVFNFVTTILVHF
jgi:hypothetical protein